MHNHPSTPPPSARSRFVRAFLSLIAALGLVAGISAVPAAAASPPTYVGLGDSVAAGTGGTDYTGPAGCLRTLQAYSTQLGGLNAACYGATTDLVAGQAVAAGVSAATRRVTITIGANDVNVGGVAAACVPTDPTQPVDQTACEDAIANSTNNLIPELPGKIADMIGAVKAKAPNARITLTGYPLLFTVWGLPVALQPLAAKINLATASLNTTIATAALRNGALYTDVTWRFLGHGYGSPQPWINGPSATDPGALHPNSAGYTYGYVPAVRPFVG
jgi:lysophospholipase L1-like esterase